MSEKKLTATVANVSISKTMKQTQTCNDGCDVDGPIPICESLVGYWAFHHHSVPEGEKREGDRFEIYISLYLSKAFTIKFSFWVGLFSNLAFQHVSLFGY